MRLRQKKFFTKPFRYVVRPKWTREQREVMHPALSDCMALTMLSPPTLTPPGGKRALPDCLEMVLGRRHSHKAETGESRACRGRLMAFWHNLGGANSGESLNVGSRLALEVPRADCTISL